MRLDQYLYSQRKFDSREKAKQAIEAGLVSINANVVTKVSKKVQKDDLVTVNDEEERFVSRAGYKLSSALEHYKINPQGMICLDIGSSTGGFTQCLLRRGAEKVVAVDVGSDQMHKTLVNHPRLELYENTDFRIFEANMPKLDLVVIDVSFISIRKIFPKLKEFLQPDTLILALFKPQFEVGKENLKKGICRHPDLEEVISDFNNFLQKMGLTMPEDAYKVPVKGKEGNQEFVVKILALQG